MHGALLGVGARARAGVRIACGAACLLHMHASTVAAASRPVGFQSLHFLPSLSSLCHPPSGRPHSIRPSFPKAVFHDAIDPIRPTCDDCRLADLWKAFGRWSQQLTFPDALFIVDDRDSGARAPPPPTCAAAWRCRPYVAHGSPTVDGLRAVTSHSHKPGRMANRAGDGRGSASLPGTDATATGWLCRASVPCARMQAGRHASRCTGKPACMAC